MGFLTCPTAWLNPLFTRGGSRNKSQNSLSWKGAIRIVESHSLLLAEVPNTEPKSIT